MSFCEAYIEDVSALLDGELDELAAKRAEAHLEACAECKALYDELSAVQGAFPEMETDVPPRMAPGVMHLLSASSTENPWRRRVARLIPIAACVVVIVWISGQGDNASVNAPIYDYSTISDPGGGWSETAKGQAPEADGASAEVKGRYVETHPTADVFGVSHRYIVAVDADEWETIACTVDELDEILHKHGVVMQNEPIAIDPDSDRVLIIAK